MSRMKVVTVEGKVISIDFEADEGENLQGLFDHLKGELLSLALLEERRGISTIHIYAAQLKRAVDCQRKITVTPEIESRLSEEHCPV